MVQGHRRFGTIGSYLVGLVAFQLVLVLALVAYAARQDFRKSRVDAVASMTTTAKAASHFLAEDMQSNVDSLNSLPDLMKTFTVAQLCESEKQSETTPWDDRWTVTDVHLLKPDGTPICAYESKQRNVAGEGWFKQALHGKDVVEVGPVTDAITGKRALIWALSLPNQHAVVAISARLDTTGKALDTQFGSAAHPVEFVVVSGDRKTEIAGSGAHVHSITGTGFSKTASSSKNEFVDSKGQGRFWAEASVRNFGWHVYAGIRTSDAYAAARQDAKQRAGLAVLFSVLALLVAGLIHRRIVRPIHSLRKASRSVTEGNFDTSVSPSGPTELVELAQAFNHMVDVRAEAHQALDKAFVAEQRVANELREVDQMRNAFLMAISHELRTPLTSVVGFASMLQTDRETMSEADVARCIEAVASQSKRLERLLLDLLDIDRLGRGVLEPRRAETDVRSLVQTVVDRSGQASRITVQVSGSPRACVDPALSERILENLVTNAIRHTTPDSKIWVRARRRNGHLELVVDDNGKGVPDRSKETVFEPFKQENDGEHVSGTGVGLTLVRQFAKLQGGEAWVQDRRGGGASFRVNLPSVEAASRAKAS